MFVDDVTPIFLHQNRIGRGEWLAACPFRAGEEGESVSLDFDGGERDERSPLDVRLEGCKRLRLAESEQEAAIASGFP